MGSLIPLLEGARGAFVFVIVITILVAVHELGHFLAARALGMEVDAFALMMGGVRKTDLSPLLKKALVPSKVVWIVGALFHVMLIAGAVSQSLSLTMASLALVGLVLPVWVVTRIGALYHMNLMSSVGRVVKTWAVAAVLSFVATGGKGLNPAQFMGLIALASLVGTLLVYYAPVLGKQEDTPQGHGFIEVERDPTATETGDPESKGQSQVPVVFRPVFHFKDKKGTEFSLLCWPLGGFAAIKGMHPKEDGSETTIPGGFYSKPPLARLAVLFAGPLFSIVFGMLLYSQLLVWYGDDQLNPAPVIGAVSENGPAAKAGLKEGDRILSVNGVAVASFYDVMVQVRKCVKPVGDHFEPEPVSLDVDRNGTPLHVTAVPTIDKEPTRLRNKDMEFTEERAVQARLEFSPTLMTVKYALGPALVRSAYKPVEMVKGLASSFMRPAEIKDNIGGPASVAQAVTVATILGFDKVVLVAAMLSISLGVMNLLPIVPLDGGQMLVAFAELLRGGRRLSLQVQGTLSTVGALLVFMLVLGVVTLDIGHIAGR